MNVSFLSAIFAEVDNVMFFSLSSQVLKVSFVYSARIKNGCIISTISEKQANCTPINAI